MVDKQYLLNTKQMAQFVADGFLRFDELVPEELNRAACAEMEAGVPRGRAGAPLAELWSDAVGRSSCAPAPDSGDHSQFSRPRTRSTTTTPCIRLMPTTSTGRFGTPTRLSTPGCTLTSSFFTLPTTRRGRWAAPCSCPAVTTAASVSRTSPAIKTSSGRCRWSARRARWPWRTTASGTAPSPI